MKSWMSFALAALLLSGCGSSLSTMRSSAYQRKIEEDAPIAARLSIEIDAPIATVWALLADVDGWPTWHAKVKEAHLSGPLAAEGRFKWKGGGPTVSSQLVDVQAPKFIGWTGTMMGMKAIHLWQLEEISPSRTRVTTSESMDGFMISLFFSKKKLETVLRQWLQALEAAAEKSSHVAPGPGPCSDSTPCAGGK